MAKNHLFAENLRDRVKKSVQLECFLLIPTGKPMELCPSGY
jgi:hypothetical protein